MRPSLLFVRTLFCALCIFFMIAYKITITKSPLQENVITGICLGLLISIPFLGLDLAFRKLRLRSLNTITLGLFFGYLLGKALVLIFLEVCSFFPIFQGRSLEITQTVLFLFGTYLGTLLTLKASKELYLSIPFACFSSSSLPKNPLLLNLSALADSRMIDAAMTGFFDKRLIVPRFLERACIKEAELGDEFSKIRAKRALDTIKKLEAIPHLELRKNDMDFLQTHDLAEKLLHLAQFLDADILSADLFRCPTASCKGVRTLNLHTLANALKPVTQRGEHLRIKIQRQGKEPTQGIGYLEDGSMVVVNGAGSFIGEFIETEVLSVKHTSSGRMIFCNAYLDEEQTSCEFFEEQTNES